MTFRESPTVKPDPQIERHRQILRPALALPMVVVIVVVAFATVFLLRSFVTGGCQLEAIGVGMVAPNSAFGNISLSTPIEPKRIPDLENSTIWIVVSIAETPETRNLSYTFNGAPAVPAFHPVPSLRPEDSVRFAGFQFGRNYSFTIELSVGSHDSQLKSTAYFGGDNSIIGHFIPIDEYDDRVYFWSPDVELTDLWKIWLRPGLSAYFSPVVVCF